MKTFLKKGFLLFLVLSLPLGFFIKHDPVLFFWHRIPSVEALFGGLGALFLIGMIKGVAFVASRREDFYD